MSFSRGWRGRATETVESKSCRDDVALRANARASETHGPPARSHPAIGTTCDAGIGRFVCTLAVKGFLAREMAKGTHCLMAWASGSASLVFCTTARGGVIQWRSHRRHKVRRLNVAAQQVIRVFSNPGKRHIGGGGAPFPVWPEGHVGQLRALELVDGVRVPGLHGVVDHSSTRTVVRHGVDAKHPLGLCPHNDGVSGGSPAKVSGGSPAKVSGGSPANFSGGSPANFSGRSPANFSKFPAGLRRGGAREAPGRKERTNWTACEAPGRQERAIWRACEAPGRHQGAGKDQWDNLGGTREAPGRHQGGRKGRIGQPGRRQGHTREAGKD